MYITKYRKFETDIRKALEARKRPNKSLEGFSNLLTRLIIVESGRTDSGFC